ncbi:MAG: response regulator [Dehalococcoidia bacterium]|nr:response regulator [Dehalococcoidia bacterium]
MASTARILVVDDDPLNRMLLRMNLEEAGHEVIEADNGLRALETLAANPVDLVLMDIEMPELDGYGVLDARRSVPSLRDTPWVVVSAVDDMESIVRCIKAGADDYLPKPFDPVILKARVDALLEKKRLRDQEKALVATVTNQAEELRAWNAQLEQRVAEGMYEVARLSKLRRFLPPQIVDLIVSGGEEQLSSHRRDITVVFCDLRGFTSFSETAEPEDVMDVLHELHEAVCPIVFDRGGTLAHFTGDGMMIFLNDPISSDNPALQGVRLGMEMRDRAAQLSMEWQRRGHVLGLGVGVASGYATCGRIGFGDRYEYTAIGTVPNLAARLCGVAAGGEVLVSERVFRIVEGDVTAEPAGSFDLKGLSRPVNAFRLTGVIAG